MPLRFFNNYLRLPVLLMAISEVGIIFGAVYAGVALRYRGDLINYASVHGPVWPKALILSTVVFMSLLALGLYQMNQRLYVKDTLARLAVALALAAFPLTAIWFALPQLALGRGVAVLAAVVAFVGLTLIRWVFLHTVDDNIFRRRTLVLGVGEKSQAIHRLRRRADRRGFLLVGNIITQGDSDVQKVEYSLKHDRPLLEIAEELGADEIVIAVEDRRGNLPVDELLACKLRGIDVLDLLGFLERETGKIRIELIDPSWMIFSSGFRITPLRRMTKRVMDVVFAAFALIFAAPILLLSALAIRLEDGLRAPVLYLQKRIGYNGTTFELIKLRSMIVDAEDDGEARWAELNDPRITRVGKVIRKLRVDELFQIVNVLRGEMSWVGPRPERPEFVDSLSGSIPFYAERHSVKPGITGWAQIKYQYGSSEHDALEKLQYDLYYVKNHNVLLDLAIMMQTVEVILWGKGAR